MTKTILEFRYISNIKPRFSRRSLTTFYNILKIKAEPLDCLLFFIYVKILINFFKKKKGNVKKLILFSMPYKKKTLTLLRAPYRYKLARDQLTFSRYRINLKFIIVSNILSFRSYADIFFILYRFIFNFKNYGGNVCILHSLKISFFFKLNKFFYYNY